MDDHESASHRPRDRRDGCQLRHLSESEAAEAVEAAHEAFRDWRETDFDERSERLRAAAEVLKDRKDEFAELMAREDLRDELHEPVVRSVAGGARCLLGGEVPDGPGSFYPPTVLTDVEPGMPAYDEELFGPVAAILPADDEDEAIRIANDSSFGLGAAVFTGDVDKGRRLAADRLEAGCCFVNAFVRSDPRLPFGGIKDSGYGRELGLYGIRSFVNVKTVYVA